MGFVSTPWGAFIWIGFGSFVSGLCPVSGGSRGVWFKGLPRLTVNNELRMVIPISERDGVIMITYTDNRFADYWKGVWQRGGESGMNRRIRALIRDAIGMDIPDAEEIRMFYWRRGWGIGGSVSIVLKYLKRSFSLFMICLVAGVVIKDYLFVVRTFLNVINNGWRGVWKPVREWLSEFLNKGVHVVVGGG